MFAAIAKRSRIGLLIALMTAPGMAQERVGRSPSDVSKQLEGLKETPAVIEMAVDSRAVSYNQDQPPGRVDVEMLTRAENRADALRAQLVNLQMKEFELQARIDELDYQMSPESIQRAFAFVGSVRPMDELRANLRARLEREKARTSTQLELLATARAKLEAAIRDAEAECDRLRQRLRLTDASGGGR